MYRPMRITLVRHGETTGQSSIRFFGQTDVPLSDVGREQMRRAGAEYVQVRLPANQPALVTVGAGLVELGLGYGALIPGFRAATDGGDVLVTQWIADIDVDASSFAFANDAVRDLVLAVVEQAQEAGSRGADRQRRAARRAQLFAALGD